MSPLAIGGLFGLTAALLFVGLFRGNTRRPDRIQQRVEQLRATDKKDAFEGSFYERVIEPMGKAFVGITSRLLPSRLIGAVGRKLEETGGSMQTQRFMAIWVMFAFIWAVIGAPLLFVIVPGLILLLALPAWVGLGVYIPWLMLRRKAQQRVKAIDKKLPDAIDLIVTSVESGLGLQAAMMKVTEYVDGPISEEFARAGHEGQPRPRPGGGPLRDRRPLRLARAAPLRPRHQRGGADGHLGLPRAPQPVRRDPRAAPPARASRRTRSR